MAMHLLQRGVAVLLLLVVVAAGWYFFSYSEHGPDAVAPQLGPPPRVNTVVVQPAEVPLMPRFLGQTQASQVVEIRARVDGFLQEQAFREGEPVEPGELLYRIDPRSYRAELEVARAGLAAAEARHAQAAQDVEQMEQLRSRNAATQQEYDDAVTAERVAAAEVQLSQARIAQAELDVGYTEVRTPIRGVIGESYKDAGAYVAPGADSLLAVVSQLDPIYVRFSVSEAEMLRWQAAAEAGEISSSDLSTLDVIVELSDRREYPHVGRINYVDVRVDPSTGTRVVRSTVPNPEGLLTPGQSVHATLRGAIRTGALLVPQQAVMHNPTGATVYVVNEEGVPENRGVRLGDWYEDHWIIESGLLPGERVVVDNLMKVRPGVAVEVVDGATDGAAQASPRL